MITRTTSEFDACKVAFTYIAHVIDAKLHVYFRSKETGILVYAVDVVLDRRYVDAAQTVGEGGGGEI